MTSTVSTAREKNSKLVISNITSQEHSLSPPICPASSAAHWSFFKLKLIVAFLFHTHETIMMYGPNKKGYIRHKLHFATSVQHPICTDGQTLRDRGAAKNCKTWQFPEAADPDTWLQTCLHSNTQSQKARACVHNGVEMCQQKSILHYSMYVALKPIKCQV